MGMMEEIRVHRTIERLLADREKGAPFDGTFDKDIVPRSVPEAYRVQDSLIRRFGARGLEPGGWRISLTTEAAQDRAGVTYPVVGPEWRRDLLASPAAVPAGARHAPCAGPELAFRVREDMGPDDGPWTRESAGERLGAAMLAVGVTDDRGAGALPHAAVGLLIADLGGSAGCALGREVEDWRELGLDELEIETSLDGRPLAAVSTASMLAHPVEVVAWVAKHLNIRRRRLEAGDVVLTGCLGEPVAIGPGDEIRAACEPLGEAVLRIEG